MCADCLPVHPPDIRIQSALLDIIDNLPRLRLSSAQLKIVLWLLRETGARDVPSFNRFRTMQEQLRTTTAIRTDAHKSDIGNTFHANDINDIIAQDFSNPQNAHLIQKFPEVVEDGPISEVWQFPDGRWRELPIDELMPSILVQDRRFYVHEVAELDDGRWFIPRMWVDVRRQNQVETHVEGRLDNDLLSVGGEIIRIPVVKLKYTHEELMQRMQAFADAQIATSHEYAENIPNKHRKIDNGEDLYTVWVQVWGDDVSGARTKQYQKHINIYASNANLPGRLLQQECNVHFISTSQTASVLEQVAPTIEKMKKTHTAPHRCYNAATGRGCGFRTNVSDLAADNPQQSEESSHIGHQGLRKCRGCKIGGPASETETPEGYTAFYKIGALRNVAELRECVTEQIRVASYGVAEHVKGLQTLTGVKDKIAQHWIMELIARARTEQAKSTCKSDEAISGELLAWLATKSLQPYNPFLNMPNLDPSQDTMVEILHTISLGLEKYAWHDTSSEWTTAQSSLFVARLQSTSTDGLSGPPIRAQYMVQYRNNLIGKQLKTLMQTTAFHIDDLTSDAKFQLSLALGDLGSMLWIAEIDDLELYLSQLQILIDNVLDAFSLVDPAKITIKIKLHMLLHIVPNIRRRGPAVRFATEVFECYNAVFRFCSIFSNHQAPSRDIAHKLADLERIKHVLCGGYWKRRDSPQWDTAGTDLRDLIFKHPILQRHVGWAPSPERQPGLCKAIAKEKRAVTALHSTFCGLATDATDDFSPSSTWLHGVSMFAKSGDRCGVGSWIVFQPGAHSTAVRVGRITEILIPSTSLSSTSTSGLVCVDTFEVSAERHPRLKMPVLRRARSATDISRIASKSVLFLINVQHDCRAFGCAADGFRNVIQERRETDLTVAVIKHRSDDGYIINMHSIHNRHLLNRVLPPSLTRPVPLFENRQQRLQGLAVELASKLKVKRDTTKAKTAETKRRKKEALEKEAAGDNNAVTKGVEARDTGESAEASSAPAVEISNISPAAPDAMDMDEPAPDSDTISGVNDGAGQGMDGRKKRKR
ncbi:hypothetical protein GGG16DRAFT_46832 [Schizophyllum commune]